MTFFIGVDGGGTRTRAVILDEEGRELARGAAPGAVATARAPDEVGAAVSAAVRVAADEAKLSLPGAVLWAGLAGAGAEEARHAVLAVLDRAGLAERVLVGTDVEAAFQDAFPQGPGVLLIAGTGSIAWARSDDGAVCRVGGWGRLLGDEGSGYALGLEGLRLVMRAEDGRAPPTALTERLITACGVRHAAGLVSWVDGAEKAEVAALAPTVVSAADEGDAGARVLVDAAVDELVMLVRSASENRQHPVVLWGGLVAGDGPLGPRVVAALRRVGYGPVDVPVAPALGAARLALAYHASEAS